MNMTNDLQMRFRFESLDCRYWIERFVAERQFAVRFRELHPGHAAEWGALIERASAEVERLPRIGDPEALRAAVGRAERILDPLAKFAKRYTIHCVAHAHIDMNWTWSWPETVATVNDTFQTALRFLDEFPDFTFSQSQASIYAIVEKFNPEMLERIRRRVREKRWEVTASHWVENDKNMTGGEALTRHLLYTRRYMEKLFGLAPGDVRIDWAPDTFGHAATVPAYLARGGVRYCYLHRPGNATDPKPGAFWWRSPDGSQILVRNDMKNGYGGKIRNTLADRMFEFVEETGGRHFMFVYGIGDHGGGPTRQDLNRIVDMSSWPVYPRVRFSTAHAFFDALAEEGARLPVLAGELNFEFTGCYTTQSQIKKANRESENRLADAEFAALLDWRLGRTPYPGTELEECWRTCLFNQFHDILPGSGVRATRQYTMGHVQDLFAVTGMTETLALRRIAGMISTLPAGESRPPDAAVPPYFREDASGAGVGVGTGGGLLSRACQAGQGDRPFVIFNPLEQARAEVVEATVWDNPAPGDGTGLENRRFAVIAPDGTRHEAQLVASGHEVGHPYVRLAFPVSVAGFGYAVYVVTESAGDCGAKPFLKPLKEPHHCVYASHERTARFGGENRYVRLEINPVIGGILHLEDKLSGLDMIAPDHQLPLLEYSVERPRPMSAWCIEFSSPPEPPCIRSIVQEASGPYAVRVRVEAEIRNSRFSVVYGMTADNPLVTIDIEGDWLEAGNPSDGSPALRMPFPLHLDSAAAVCEIPFGAVKRNCRRGEEVPALQWVKIGDRTGEENAGMLLVNDCKYGYSLDDKTLRVSLIRGSYFPDRCPEFGEHEVRLGVLPFSGGLSDAAAAQIGRGFNRRLKVVGTDLHSGTMPSAGGFLRLSGDDVVISGVKKAEDGDALVVRLYETAGNAKTVKLAFDRCLGKVAGAETVDLLERPVEGECRTDASGNAVELAVPRFALVSVRVAFAPDKPERESRPQ